MSEQTYNLLSRSCFDAAKLSGTMYKLGDDGWCVGGTEDAREWYYDNAEWSVTLPAGTYTLSYEVDGTQGDKWDQLVAYLGEDGASFAFGHTDGPALRTYTFALTAETAVRLMAKCYAPARFRLMLVEGTTPAAWAPAEGESLPGGGCSDER